MNKYFSLVGLVFYTLLISACVTKSNEQPIQTGAAHEKRIELGMKYLALGRRDNARRQFSAALELQSNSAQAYQGIAIVHLGNGEIEPAGVAFKKALKYSNEKNRSSIEVSYGRYLMKIDKDQEACDYFEKAGNDYDYTGRVEALHLAGQCAQKTGDLERVKGAYEHALNINPQYLPVFLDLAVIYFKDAEYAECRSLLDRYEKVAQPSAQSLWLGIQIERIFGNKDKEASYALALKNRHPYSSEYLKYRQLVQNK